LTYINSLLDQVIQICDQQKASQITAYKLYNPLLTDYVLLVSVSNIIHCKTLVENLKTILNKTLKKQNNPDYYEHPKLIGDLTSGWLILDLNAIVIHILLGETRDHYDLDNFYAPISASTHHH
jgi:ribosome-associated protein